MTTPFVVGENPFVRQSFAQHFATNTAELPLVVDVTQTAMNAITQADQVHDSKRPTTSQGTHAYYPVQTPLPLQANSEPACLPSFEEYYGQMFLFAEEQENANPQNPL